MNVLEKILEEIKQPTNYTVMCGKHFTTIDRVEEIIRSHMDDCKTFEFDFNRVKSFDCQCGRHYVNTYNNGWTPVEEKLPEEGEEVLAQFVVRVRYMNNKVDEAVYIHTMHYENGAWKSYAGVPNGKVEAWQPLPKPYKGE